MRYIRFLKAPRFEGDTIKALATITSDLGEDYMHTACDLVPVLTIYSATADGQDSERKDITLPTRTWNAGSRAVPITYVVSSKEQEQDTRSRANAATTYILAVYAVDVQTGAKSLMNRLPGGGGGRRADAEFPLILSVASSVFSRAANAGARAQRMFEVADGSTLTIWETSGDSIEGHIWDAGYATIGFFNHMLAGRLRHEAGREFVQTDEPRRMDAIAILELGCGTGLVGLFLASMVPHCAVTLTDLPSAQELVEINIQELHRPATGSTVAFSVLEWGGGRQPLPDEIQEQQQQQQWHLVLASDVNYNPDNAQALVDTIDAIGNQCPDVLVFVASKKRHESESVFGQIMLQHDWTVHNKFGIALPTDDTPSTSMWTSAGTTTDTEMPHAEIDTVEFTLYTRKRSDESGHDALELHAQPSRNQMLADLWIPSKQWPDGLPKRKRNSRAKAVAKAKRKRTGLPYEYGT